MSAGGRKMSLGQATMLVAGNMIGTGVFLLPVNLAQVGSIAIFGWVVATVGVAALGLVFAKLGQLDPQPGGPYAYARDFLGPYAGFQTNYIYWFGNWIGNIAIAVAGVGYLAELIPGISSPPGSVVATLAVIWLFTFANILGPRVVGALQSWTVAIGLIPILGIALFGWFWFDSANFTAGWNVSGESNLHAISRAASMALWAYMGIESAAVSAGVIENPSRNVPLATLMGLGLAAVVYLLSSTVLMGILPNDVLRASSAPFAEAARLALGTAGAIVISVCAVLKSFGTLGGWMLLVSQSGKAAADDGMFPRIFARLNGNGVPGAGLVIVAVLMTIVLFATISPTLAGQFNNMVDLAVMLIIVPYVYAAVSVVKVIADRKLPASTFTTYKWLALGAVAYCVWAVIGGDPDTVVRAMVALLISVPLYPFFIRSMEEAAKRKAEARSRAVRSRRGYHAMNMYTCLIRSPAMQPITTLVDPSGGRRRTLLAAAVLALLALPAFGQEEAAAPEPPGLPSGLDWTLIFDATAGAFSFADSLYTNPKPENRQGISATTGSKGRSKPGSRGRTRRTARRSSTVQFTGVGERTYGTPPSLVGDEANSFGVEDFNVGWRSGNSLGDEENVLDFTLGRARYRLGHGMLLWDGAVGRRQPRRLLDEPTPGVRDGGDRPVQARQSHHRGVLSRQGRPARGQFVQRVVGSELRVRVR